MKRAIWRYPLSAFGRNLSQVDITMPKGAVVLHVGLQLDIVTLWAEVDPGAPAEARSFEIHGTGWEFQAEGRKHLGTVITADQFVWHVYEHRR